MNSLNLVTTYVTMAMWNAVGHVWTSTPPVKNGVRVLPIVRMAAQIRVQNRDRNVSGQVKMAKFGLKSGTEPVHVSYPGSDADCQSSTFCNECSTAECLAFADIINSKLDESVDPCVDFDAFSCGGWKAENEIPPDSGSYGQFSVVRKALSETVKRELELESTEEYHGWEAVRKAKAFYALCMDEKTIDAESTMQLKPGFEIVGSHNLN